MSIKYVFISATKTDLEDHRRVLIETLELPDDVKCLSMERFGPQPKSAIPQCLEKIEKSDLFVGLIGHYRGWEPDGDELQRSITEMEYDHAISMGKPVFMVVLPEDQVTLKPCDREPQEKWDRQIQFRNKIKGEYVVEVEKYEPKDIAISVSNSIHEYQKEELRQQVEALTEQLNQSAQDQPLPPEEIQKEREHALETAIDEELLDPQKILNHEQDLDLEELMDSFLQKAEQSRDHAVQYYKYVGALAFQNHTQKALEAYTRVVELDPNDADGLNMLGLIQQRLGDLEAAKQSFEKILALSNQVEDKTIIAMGLGNLGVIYQTQGDLSRAEDYHLRALSLEEELGRKEGMATQMGNLGVVYQRQGDLSRAEDHHLRALSLEEELGGKEGMANHLGNLGLIYRSQRDLSRAEDHHFRSLSLNEELGSKEGIATQLGNLGQVYRTQGDLSRAENHYLRALSLNEELGRKEGIAKNLGNLGLIYRSQRDLSRAEDHHFRSLSLNEELGSKEGIATQLGSLGLVYEDKGDIASACKYWRQALQLFKEIGMQPQIEIVQGWIYEAGCVDQD